MTPARFGTTSTEVQRKDMVEHQLRRRGITDQRVLSAMEEVPRELFLPEDQRRRAYRDGAVGIDAGQTMSQPWIVACMTALLEPRPDDKMLEVGAGSGYAAAVLSRCVARVVTIERHAVLADQAAMTLRELGYGNVEVRTGDGTRGAPDAAPFDGISVTASADERPPQALFDQLADDGVLVCPVKSGLDRELLMRFDKRGNKQSVVPVRFVPLVAGEGSEG